MGAFAPVTNSLQPPSDYVQFQQSYMSTFRCRCFPLLHSCMMLCLLADSDKHVRGRHGDEPETSGCRPASRHHRREPQSHAGQSISSAQSPAVKQCTRCKHNNILFIGFICSVSWRYCPVSLRTASPCTTWKSRGEHV